MTDLRTDLTKLADLWGDDHPAADSLRAVLAAHPVPETRREDVARVARMLLEHRWDDGGYEGMGFLCTCGHVTGPGEDADTSLAFSTHLADAVLAVLAAPPTREDVDALARVVDPEAFEDHPIEQRQPLAAIQWAARRKIATDHAERVVAHLAAPEDDLPGASWQNPAPAASLREAAAVMRSGHQDIHLVQLTSDLADLLEASAAWVEAGGVLPAFAALAHLAGHILGDD